jgi:hypothetical protein
MWSGNFWACEVCWLPSNHFKNGAGAFNYQSHELLPKILRQLLLYEVLWWKEHRPHIALFLGSANVLWYCKPVFFFILLLIIFFSKFLKFAYILPSSRPPYYWKGFFFISTPIFHFGLLTMIYFTYLRTFYPIPHPPNYYKDFLCARVLEDA